MEQRAVLGARLLSNREITADGCWLWTKSCVANGYGQTSIPQGPPHVLVHRAAAWLWLGYDLADPLRVLHRCDVRRCFNPAHLFLGTVADNQRDMAAKGRARGGIRGDALTDERIAEIRTLVASGMSRRDVANAIGVSHTTVVRHTRDLPKLHWTKKLEHHR